MPELSEGTVTLIAFLIFLAYLLDRDQKYRRQGVDRLRGRRYTGARPVNQSERRTKMFDREAEVTTEIDNEAEAEMAYEQEAKEDAREQEAADYRTYQRIRYTEGQAAADAWDAANEAAKEDADPDADYLPF